MAKVKTSPIGKLIEVGLGELLKSNSPIPTQGKPSLARHIMVQIILSKLGIKSADVDSVSIWNDGETIKVATLDKGGDLSAFAELLKQEQISDVGKLTHPVEG